MNKQLFILSGITVFKEGVSGKHKISGGAIHPVKTYHPKEWIKIRQYIEPYLEQAAPSLAKAKLVINHKTPLPPENKLHFSRWNTDTASVDFEGEITEEVYQLFKNGTLQKRVSIGLDWMRPGGGIIVDGVEAGVPVVIPYGFSFDELSFLTQGMEAGDFQSNLQIWESVLKEAQSVEESRCWVWDEKLKGYVEKT